MLQLAVILFICYVTSLVFEFYRLEKHWEEIQRDSKEEK